MVSWEMEIQATNSSQVLLTLALVQILTMQTSDNGNHIYIVMAGLYGSAIAAGSSHTCAIVNNGDVKCWGYNYFGQLGLGDTINRLNPTAVSVGEGA